MGEQTTWETLPGGAVRPPRIPVTWGFSQPPIHRGELMPSADGEDWVIETDVTDAGSGRIFVVATVSRGDESRDIRGVAVVVDQFRSVPGRQMLRIEFEFVSAGEDALRTATGQSSRSRSREAGQASWISPDPDRERLMDDDRPSWESLADAAVERITVDEEHRSSLDGESLRTYSTVRWQPTLMASALAGIVVLVAGIVALLIVWPFSA